MPHLTEPKELADTVAVAVKGRAHWVFITDSAEGHLRLVTLASLLLNSGLTDNDIDYGVSEYLNLATRDHRILSLLTVPKKKAGRQRIGVLMKAARMGVGKPKSGQDLICLSGPDTPRADELMRVLELFSKGKMFAGSPGDN